MFDNRNTFTIVFNGNKALSFRDSDLDQIHVLVALIAVSSIHYDLVIDFVKSRRVLECSLDHIGPIFSKDPLKLLMFLKAADVGVRALENMLDGG